MRAIFDDAGNIIPGEDVKIAGVKVGKVGSLTPRQAKAAVVLDITERGFKDFRNDASCTIRPQALIGEKYVECLPTQPRAARHAAAAEAGGDRARAGHGPVPAAREQHDAARSTST